MEEIKADLKAWVTEWEKITKFHRRDDSDLSTCGNHGDEEVNSDRNTAGNQNQQCHTGNEG